MNNIENLQALIPPSPKKFYNLVDNNFTTTYATTLNSAQFEQRKKEFLDSADARMIIYLLTQISKNSFEKIILVTEQLTSTKKQISCRRPRRLFVNHIVWMEVSYMYFDGTARN